MKPTLEEPLIVLNTKSGFAFTILATCVVQSSSSSGTYSSPTISMPSSAAYCLMILLAVRGKT